jgi:hypothetical protein
MDPRLINSIGGEDGSREDKTSATHLIIANAKGQPSKSSNNNHHKPVNILVY